MKIALLGEKYTPDIGGLAISTERLGHLLALAGHEVRVFAPSANLPPSEKRILNLGGVDVLRFGAHKRVDDTLVDWFELLVEEHRRAAFDVVHAFFLHQAGFVAAYAGKYLSLPSVASIRGNDIERAAFDPSRFSQVMFVLQNADALTTNACELVRKTKAFVDREVVLIPNGIETNVFRPVQRNIDLAGALELATQEGVPPRVVGFAGELREKKGLEALLRAYAQTNIKHPTALLIVGEVRPGRDTELFNELVKPIRDARIIVTGTVSHQDMPYYYAWMDVFVHPSLRDGMPNALLEAMACEKAVIATAVGGAKDVLEHGKNGIIVGVNDANALAGRINELLDDTDLRGALGRQARLTIQGGFSPENELAANIAVYKNLGLKI